MTTCTKCLRAQVWQRLELVERMSEKDVRAFVTSWPEGVAIEVRRCTCGSAMARKASTLA